MREVALEEFTHGIAWTSRTGAVAARMTALLHQSSN